MISPSQKVVHLVAHSEQTQGDLFSDWEERGAPTAIEFNAAAPDLQSVTGVQKQMAEKLLDMAKHTRWLEERMFATLEHTSRIALQLGKETAELRKKTAAGSAQTAYAPEPEFADSEDEEPPAAAPAVPEVTGFSMEDRVTAALTAKAVATGAPLTFEDLLEVAQAALRQRVDLTGDVSGISRSGRKRRVHD